MPQHQGCGRAYAESAAFETSNDEQQCVLWKKSVCMWSWSGPPRVCCLWSLLPLYPVGSSSLMQRLVSRPQRHLSAPSCHGHSTECGWLMRQES